jgi:hypothetical protein
VYWIALFLIPVGLILVYSFFQRSRIGGVDYIFTLDNYIRTTEPLYLKVFWFSVRSALFATAISLLLGYATAYFIATRQSRYRLPLLVLVVLPFWTNLLIRTYSWIALLNNEGLINRTLENLGLIDEPLPLLNNQFSIVLGLVYAYLPLMVLPLYASIERLGPSPREAAGDLGASPTSGFFRRDGGVHLRVRAEPRELHRPRPARRRTEVDDRQPHPAAVLHGERLAVRRRARHGSDHRHDASAGDPSAGPPPGREDDRPWHALRRRPATAPWGP